MAWVYILRGSSGRYSIGSTENLTRRLEEHRRGGKRAIRTLIRNLRREINRDPERHAQNIQKPEQWMPPQIP
jgi:predicted GIY-YIG superfamily endonuclease